MNDWEVFTEAPRLEGLLIGSAAAHMVICTEADLV